ncbi:Uncharacterized protein Rs2_11075 [Raphanus sativus]|nr:Uncharacterized protein Rs2_11075 [Raphanus sativus]
MASSSSKVSSTPLFYGDSRFENLLPLSLSLRLEDPHRRSPSISSQAHSPTTKSDGLTGVSGIPHKTRFFDLNLFQFRVMRSPSLNSLTIFADETSSAAVRPQPLHSSISFEDLKSCIGGFPSTVSMTRITSSSAASHHASSVSFHHQGHDPTFLKLGHHILNLDLASPMIVNCKWLSPLLFQPTIVWGLLISLIKCLKTSDGFNGVFTEAVVVLPVGSPETSPAPVLLKKRTVLPIVSLIKSVSLPNNKWKCPSISITVLLSCGVVRSGPEDAAGFVSTRSRGADWMSMSTSQYKVTISLLSDHVVKASFTMTHSGCSLNSLSIYPRGFSKSISYVVLFSFYCCASSSRIVSFSKCNLKF